MSKRGQTTLFVILGLVIITIVGLLLLNIDRIKEQVGLGVIIPEQLREVSNHVENCLEETSIGGLNYISQHGGYYKTPEPNIVFFTEKIPYYFKDNLVTIPEIKRIERELSGYIKDNLNVCLDFEEFRENGFVIEAGNPLMNSEVNDKFVVVNLNYPLTIERGEVSTRVNDFSVTLDSNLKKLNGVSKLIVNNYKKNVGLVCLTCIEEISNENNVIINPIPADSSFYNKDIIWFLITDKEFNLNGGNLTLKFVVEK